MYQFLGQADTFHGQIREGRLQLGDTEFVVPEHESLQDTPATAYVRPHEIKVHAQTNGGPNIAAVIKDVNFAGPLVHLELERADDGSRFAAQLTKEESRALPLQVGLQVYVELKNIRVFTEPDYSI
ncbi:MAG: TOBE-like domain-containing protein [Verrucomicrobiales bacterium]|nr:TOBE-like domain-containing protein [Verrucomicrobiales bacterium]